MTRHRIPVLVLSLVSLSIGFVRCAPVDAPAESVEEQVRARFDELVAAAHTLDVETYMAFFDRERFTGLRADGLVMHGLEEFEAEYRQVTEAVAEYVTLDFRRVKITPIGDDVAVLVNEYDARVRLRAGGEAGGSGGGTQVWARRDGVWRLVSVSSSAAVTAAPSHDPAP